VNIRFTSSLTPEDENTLAPALLTALGAILDLLPIAYAIRVETADSRVFQRGSGGDDAPFQSAVNVRAASPFGGSEYR
jgi:hypothetical protein